MVAANIKNVFGVCPECKAEHKRFTQELIREQGIEPVDLIGEHVQLAFPIPDEDEMKENMWVLVVELDDVEDLRGQLDNTPRLAHPWKYEDWLSFRMDEIILIYVE